MIKLENVTKYYGKTGALIDVSLDIKKGEAIALIGPNGSGKSTLIKCLLGLLDYTGQILVNDVNLNSDNKLIRSMIAYVPQEACFYDMKTLDIVGFYRSLRNASTEIVPMVLKTVGLEQHSFKYTSELSGGMKQRLSFAVALISDCPVLVLDEPTSNLDKDSRDEMLELIRALKEQGKTILFSSHRLDEVYYISDRVILLKEGKLITDCPVAEFPREIVHRARLNIYVHANDKDKAKSILLQEGYSLENSAGNLLSLKIGPENSKVAAVRKLIDNNINITDFSTEEQHLEIH